MNITRHNYEEYFLLYVDNELPANERKAVEIFVRENPDLEKELMMLRQSVVQPDVKQTFTNKELLFKNTSFVNPVNESNYEEYFVLYGDNELSTEECDNVELFVYKHPRYQNEFELIQKAKLTPDAFIAFPDKTRLYRHEKGGRVIIMRWWKVAAAAIVLLFAGALGWNMFFKSPGSSPSKEPAVVKVQPREDNNPVSEPQVKNSPDTPLPSNTIGQNTQPAVPAEKIKKDKPLLAAASSPATKNIVNEPENNRIDSNNPYTQTVQPVNKDVVKVEVPPADTKKASTTTLPEEKKVEQPVVDVEVGFDKLARNDDGLKTYAVNDNNNQTEILNTSVGNKNKLRGFFRKVSRVVGRTTNLGPEESDNNKGLRIANFEIALK